MQVLHDELDKSQAVFVTDYMGMNVERIASSGGTFQARAVPIRS